MIDLKQNLKVNDWQLSKRLGIGGQGEVWSAKALTTRHSPISAIKFCKADDPKARARFREEGKILKSHHHEGIVPIRDNGDFEGMPYIVMELGLCSLGQIIDPSCPLALVLGTSMELRLRMFRQACAGVAYLHDNGVVHRDIKPSNMILMGSSGHPIRAVIADFGIAATVQNVGSMTEVHEVVGTPQYRAPETEIGGKATFQSDVYSLGRTLEFLVTKQAPVVSTPIHCPADESLSPGLRSRIDSIVSRACERSPNDRYSTAADMLASLPSVILAISGGSDITIEHREDDSESVILFGMFSIPPMRGMHTAWHGSISKASIIKIVLAELLLHDNRQQDYLIERVARASTMHVQYDAPMQVDPSAAVKIKQILMTRGLIVLEEKSTHRGRQMFWSLTSEGRRLAHALAR